MPAVASVWEAAGRTDRYAGTGLARSDCVLHAAADVICSVLPRLQSASFRSHSHSHSLCLAEAMSSAASILDTPAYAFDPSSGSWSLLLWGSLLLSVLAILLQTLRGLCGGASTGPTGAPLTWSGRLQLALFGSLIVVSALLTWTPMLQMVSADMRVSGYGTDTSARFYSLSECLAWLTSAKAHRSSSLFFVAYKQVCDCAATWYVTQQLLIFVLSYAAWLWIEGPRRGVSRTRGLMLLWIGFAGAISVSLAGVLAVGAWTRERRQVKREAGHTAASTAASSAAVAVRMPSSAVVQAPSVLLWFCILLAVVTLPLLRWTISSESDAVPRVFKLSLLVGHFALLLPFLQSSGSGNGGISGGEVALSLSPPSPAVHVRIVLLYAFLAGLALYVHLESLARVLPELVPTMAENGTAVETNQHLSFFLSGWVQLLFQTASHLHARQSIGMDVVLVYALLTLHLMTEAQQSSRQRLAWGLLMLLSILTAGAVAPISIVFPFFLLAQALNSQAQQGAEQQEQRAKVD